MNIQVEALKIKTQGRHDDNREGIATGLMNMKQCYSAMKYFKKRKL